MSALDLFALRVRAGARCQCTGQCGDRHAFTARGRQLPCRAMHGSVVVRKKDSPGFWQLAPSETSGPVFQHELYDRREEPIVLKPLEQLEVLKMLCGFCHARAVAAGPAGALAAPPKRGRKKKE